jgi:hypothetical protein
MTVSRNIYAKKGTGWINHSGYRMHGVGGGMHMAHRLIVEKVLGKKLAPEVQIHHVNENRSDNRHENLVVCPNHAYHMLLHARARAYDACGHADWHQCKHCERWDEAVTIATFSKGKPHRWFHPACQIVYDQQQYLKRKNAGYWPRPLKGQG